jgi:hypothetical protein
MAVVCCSVSGCLEFSGLTNVHSSETEMARNLVLPVVEVN